MYMFVGFLFLEEKSFLKIQKSLETNIRLPVYLHPISFLVEDSVPAVNAVGG